MARMPYNVHVHLYRQQPDTTWHYALFERSDIPAAWQGVCGGGEEGESIAEAALRECAEEADIKVPGPLYPLDNINCMPADVFPQCQTAWGADTFALPMYYFAMPYSGEVAISEEHTQFGWFPYDEAQALMPFPGQQVALWELHHRLERGLLQRPLMPWMQQRHTIQSYSKFRQGGVAG